MKFHIARILSRKPLEDKSLTKIKSFQALSKFQDIDEKRCIKKDEYRWLVHEKTKNSQYTWSKLRAHFKRKSSRI